MTVAADLSWVIGLRLADPLPDGDVAESGPCSNARDTYPTDGPPTAKARVPFGG